MLKSCDIQMLNGAIFSGKKISELTEIILDKFAEEKLSCAEAKEVMKRVEEVINECSIVQFHKDF